MNTMLIPLVGMLIPIVIVPVALGVRYARHERGLEHAERMKALDLGRTLPRDEPWWSPARISVAIGAGVPVGVFVCAWLATVSSGFHDGVWISATGVGMTAVISGSVLAAKHFAHRAQAENGLYATKPVFDDADAYDVVGRRG